MSGPVLLGAKAKLERADEQTRTLETEFAAYYGRDTYRIDQPLDRKAGRKQAIFRVTEEFPIRWSIIIGEIFHDVRSALDHAIYELTCIEQEAPLDKTEFPVFDSEPDYDSVSKKTGIPTTISGLYKVRGLNDGAKALVRFLQPFEHRKRNPPDQYPVISLIHNLNIVDKHRTLHLVRRRTDVFEVELLRDVEADDLNFDVPLAAIEDGAVLGEWTPTIFDDEPDVQIDVGFIVNFGEGDHIVNHPVVTVCDALIEGATIILTKLEETL
jgi:hypothetical protein